MKYDFTEPDGRCILASGGSRLPSNQIIADADRRHAQAVMSGKALGLCKGHGHA